MRICVTKHLICSLNHTLSLHLAFRLSGLLAFPFSGLLALWLGRCRSATAELGTGSQAYTY